MLKKVLILSLIIFWGSSPCFADIGKIQTLIISGDFMAAEKECNDLLTVKSAAAVKEQAQFYLALINLKQKRFADGRHNFNVFIRDFPKSSLLNRARLGIADTYFFEGNYSLAEKIYAELLAIKDERVASIVYARLIDLSFKQGNREKAQDYLNRLHSEYPLGFEDSLIKTLPTKIEKETQKEINPPSEAQPPSEFFTPLEKEQSVSGSGVRSSLSSPAGERDSLAGFTVQVGAFADREKADKLCKELVNGGEDAYVVLLETAVGQSLYRVRVGRLSSGQEAEALAKRLANQGYPTKVIP